MDAERARERVLAVITDTPRSDSTITLTPFEHGWLAVLTESNEGNQRGAPRYTIDERDGGVRQFPSSIPTPRILEKYLEIRDLVPVIG